jgi:DNA-binding MarR family transcriptional regulator
MYDSYVRDVEVREFRAQIRLLQRRLRLESLVVPGVSRSAFQVLGALTRLPGGSQPRQVADELRMTSSNVAAALRELEGAEFIRRQRDDPEDARRVRVFVTESGAAAVADFRHERDTWLGRAVEAVLSDDEQRALLAAGQLLQRVAEYEPAA